jgi:UDP-N-acetylglucosamine 2-epimerase (non-hydrolysing)
MLVAGARPNFVKVAPVLRALEDRSLECSLVHTGQHYDPQMSDVFFDELGIRAPNHSLEVGSGSHAQQTATLMSRFDHVIETEMPGAVVVFGDVNSTLACSLVAAKRGVRVVHVEAGLRSRDWEMPEEINRVVTDRISDLLLCPSNDAAENLLSEGVASHRVRVVGNVMIDTLLANIERATQRRVPETLSLTPQQYALVTLHRPSNVDDPETLGLLMGALTSLAKDVPVVFPTHPRTRARLQSLDVPVGVRIIDPLGYLDFLGLQASAAVVVTDSGGVQEETTALGIPCITARTSTERPITVSEGTNQVVGTDPSVIVAAAREAITNPPAARCPQLWDGRAGNRCAAAITEMLDSPNWPRPTEVVG